MPTVVTSTVRAAGGDYTSLTLWEADTDNDLVAANEQHDADVHADFTQDDTRFLGAVVDATRFRRAQAAPGEEYDPVADTGLQIAGVFSDEVLRISENFFELHHIMVDNQFTDAGTKYSFRVDNDNVIIDSCVARKTTGGGSASNAGFFASGTVEILFLNCISIGTIGTMNRGFRIQNNAAKLYNCVVFDLSGGVDNEGFSHIFWNNFMVNCAAMDCDTCFVLSGGGSNSNNCASSDSTATMDDSLTSQVATDAWEDPASNDFRLKAESNLEDAGADVTSDNPEDFDDATWPALMNIGAYEEVVPAAAGVEGAYMGTGFGPDRPSEAAHQSSADPVMEFLGFGGK